VHTVVVWCDALNATYGGAAGQARESQSSGSDEKLLQYRAGQAVIASTGAVLIPVGHLRGSKPAAGGRTTNPFRRGALRALMP
jgi:hypothetical protein